MSVQFIAPRVVMLIRPGVPLLPATLAIGVTGSGTGASSGSGSGSSGTGGGAGAVGTVSLSDLAVLVVGQSNANFTFYPTQVGQPTDTDSNYAGLGPTAAEGIKFWSHATNCEINGIGATMFQGNGLYPGASGSSGAVGSWLANPNAPALTPSEVPSGGTWVDPSEWSWDTTAGADGAKFLAYLGSLNSEQTAAIQALWYYWGENDSARAYAEKATYKGALLRFLQLTRSQLGKAPAALPFLVWSCMPSVGTDQGMCMVREVLAEIVGDAANEAYFVIAQAADCNPRGSTANANGTINEAVNNGGDDYHAQDADYGLWVRRASLPIAKAIFSAEGAASGIPAACGTGLGPSVAGASLSGNVLTVTVQHDVGTDLVLAQQALNGVGWSVMDGGSAALPGVLIPATGCVRVDPTHLAITLTGVPCNPLGACRLYYPYGNGRIGSGNAVTDNASIVARPSGWDVGAALSDTLFDQDMPMQMPFTVTDGAAACGFPLATPVVANTGPYTFNINPILPEAGTFTHGSGTLTCAVDDLSTSGYTAPAGAEFGITTSIAELPTSWTAASRYQTTLWTAYVPMPASAGIYYLVAQSLDAQGNVLARVTGGPFTVS